MKQYTHLSEEEREIIYSGLLEGKKEIEIHMKGHNGENEYDPVK